MIKKTKYNKSFFGYILTSMKGNKMFFKKLILVNLILITILFVGCFNSNDNHDPSFSDINDDTDIDTYTTLATTDMTEEIKTEASTKEPYTFIKQKATPVEAGARLCDSLGAVNPNIHPKCPSNYVEWTRSMLSTKMDITKIEESYNNIEVTLGWTEYEKDSLIEVRFDNLNGKYIIAYTIPYVEKFDESSQSWIGISYCPDKIYQDVSKWIPIWGDSGGYVFNPYYLYDPIEAGKYRFVLFIGPKVFYSPEFNVVE